MAINPEEVRNKTFPIIRRGYDPTTVHRYLDAVASEIDTFNREAQVQDEIVMADVVEDTEVVSEADQLAADTPTIDEPEMMTTVPSASDDFDRVGNEISLMLRQAQESAIKIRQDAEVEARTLVDQVRLDIEADRLAHEQAAGELITRTEVRAGEVRAEAESYSSKTRSAADDYSDERKQTAEREAADEMETAEAERKLAKESLASAMAEAESTVSEARTRADEIIANAEADAKARSDELLGEARATLTTLINAEEHSRANLEDARKNIKAALEQLRLTEIDASAISGSDS